MTDLLNGKIDFFGYEVNPTTTQDDFVQNVGDRFSKKIISLESDIISYRMNGNAAIIGYHPEIEVPIYNLYGLDFVNVEVIFTDNKIWMVTFYTNWDSFEINEQGNKFYSGQKDRERLEKLDSWIIKTLGEPTYRRKSVLRYMQKWGHIEPSSWNDVGVSKIYVNYNR